MLFTLDKIDVPASGRGPTSRGCQIEAPNFKRHRELAQIRRTDSNSTLAVFARVTKLSSALLGLLALCSVQVLCVWRSACSMESVPSVPADMGETVVAVAAVCGFILAPLGLLASGTESKLVTALHAGASLVMAIALWVLCALAFEDVGLSQDRWAQFRGTTAEAWFNHMGAQQPTQVDGYTYANRMHTVTQEWAASLSLLAGLICFGASCASIIVLARSPGSISCSFTSPL